MFLIPLAAIATALLSAKAREDAEEGVEDSLHELIGDDVLPPATPQGARGRTLVIVDVQPLYDAYLRFEVADLMRYAVNNFDAVLVIYNGPGVDGDEQWRVIEFFDNEAGEDYDLAWAFRNKCQYHEKEYGWSRDWMDYGLSDDDVVRGMIALRALKEHDARELPEHIKRRLPLDPEDWMLVLPDLSLELQHWDGSVICGGGEEACLAEVRLLARSMGVQLHQEDEFVY